MSLNIKLLSKICETPGISGFEQPIRSLIMKECEGLADEIWADNMGNVIALKKGTAKKDRKKIMLPAHMDEIGFIVHHIDDDGFIRMLPMGGFDPKTLTAQRVIIHGTKDIIGVMGSKPIHLMSPAERGKPVKISDYFIDTGMSKKEVNKYISIGDPVSRERKLIEMGDCVNCKSIDNRVSVYILIEMLREMKKCAHDVYAVFTVQEEVGLRGALTAALTINPDFGICIDTTIAYDCPPAKDEEMITQLGKGVGIKIKDSGAIADYRMVRFLKEVAKKKKISWQPELLPSGGTDTAAIQRMSGDGGAIVGALSIPTRHIHSVIEMANKEDIRSTIDLLKGALEGISKFDWSHK